ncbi:MAG: methylenetetrahydrofolate reductase [NAD(P)H] [Bacteroidales bacterium]|nr:methylenetetrahydrofolate reductase [NAD(P)H] [Bacteroidales bacterium]MCF8334583.1 methylenetetrahydrofolate reductase [NAD(P)H] [Bacteroidales bacterium]
MAEKVINRIHKSEQPLFTFELLPPLKGHTINEIYNAVDPLVEFNPAYINITYHQQEIYYKERENGLLEKKVIRKRPGTVALGAALNYKYGIPVVPHLICGGFTKEETEDALIDLHFLGINNVLAIRGDPVAGEKRFHPEPGGHKHSDGLVKQIMDMNRGEYLHDLTDATPTDFCVGVAGYPEKHAEAPNFETDLYYLKKKIEKGADYIVTQLFFDNSRYFRFVKMCRDYGIDVPIIPGIKPVSAKSDVKWIPKPFGVDIPEELVKEVNNCDNKEQAREVGVEWAIAQSKELLDAGVPGLHFYTLSRSDNIRKIARAVF